MTIIAKALGPSLGFDTSMVVSEEQYKFLKAKGYSWGCRYVPLIERSTFTGRILQAELDAALGLGMGMMFVQLARNTGWSKENGAADGRVAAESLLFLGVPNTVCLWLDLGVTDKITTIDYAKSWYVGAVSAGMEGSALGVYMEPGVPLSADERFHLLPFSRYWATAAIDPNRFPDQRGCQLIQLWGSNKGEFEPETGLMIDADVSQLDFHQDAPVAAFQA